MISYMNYVSGRKKWACATIDHPGIHNKIKMAPIGEKAERNNIMDDTMEEDDDQNLW